MAVGDEALIIMFSTTRPIDKIHLKLWLHCPWRRLEDAFHLNTAA